MTERKTLLTDESSRPQAVELIRSLIERIEVHKGDVVDLETLLGRAARELYFEIREQNEAVDPREWLR